MEKSLKKSENMIVTGSSLSGFSLTTNLKTGDVILFRNKFLWYKPMSWLSALIRFFTKFNYNHVSVVVNNWDVSFSNEAIESGVEAFPCSDRLRNKKIMVLRAVAGVYEPDFARRANSLLGVTRYDFKVLLWYQLIYQLTGKWLPNTKNNKKEDRMICSEYAAWCHELPYWYRYDPQDFDNNPYFKVVFFN